MNITYVCDTCHTVVHTTFPMLGCAPPHKLHCATCGKRTVHSHFLEGSTIHHYLAQDNSESGNSVITEMVADREEKARQADIAQALEGQRRAAADLAAVSERGNRLQNIPVPFRTPAVCLAAVTQAGQALRFVPEELKTPELCRAAVTQDGAALHSVPDALKTDELYRIAVTANGLMLRAVPRAARTPELCMLAVQQNALAFWNVSKAQQTPELCRIAVKGNARAIQYVKEQTEALCRAAIEQDHEAIRYIRNPSQVIYEEAERKRLIAEKVADFPPLTSLLYRHRALIAAEPRFRYMTLPTRLFMSAGTPPPVRLGCLVELWESDPAFTGQCDCGATTVLYSLLANVYHPELSKKKMRCTGCGKYTEVEGDSGSGGGQCFYTLRCRAKSNPGKVKTATMAELKAFLEKALDGSSKT
jgi:hypothetical protein